MSRELGLGEAIDAALDEAMAGDPRIVVLGEDVRLLRRNLLVRHGAERVLDTPISESAFLGTATTAAMSGLRPVVEIMLIDFIGVAFDGLLNHAAKFEGFSGGRWTVPLVVRATCGAGYGDGGQHGQVLWGLLAGVPGLSVVVPSNPADAAGLMRSALEAPGPVVLLEHKLLSEVWLDYMGGDNRPTVHFDVPPAGSRGPVAEPPEPVPLGVAAVRREGDDLALISAGVGVHRCVEAAGELARDGLEAEVVDLRSISPLDRDAIARAARSTGRVVIVDEDYRRGGLSGEVAAILAEDAPGAAFARVTVESTLPYARHLEAEALPHTARIVAAARALGGTRR